MDRDPGQRATNRSLAGPPHPPRPHPGDERRELPIGAKQEVPADHQLTRRSAAVRSPVAAVPPGPAHPAPCSNFPPPRRSKISPPLTLTSEAQNAAVMLGQAALLVL